MARRRVRDREDSEQEQIELTRPGLLLVEGADDLHFFDALLQHLSITEVQVIPCGGKDEIPAIISLLPKLPNFAAVERLGIVRDADTNPVGAFASVQGGLTRANIPSPSAPARVTTADGNLSTSVFIMPGEGREGELETLLCQSFADPVINRCIDQFLDCAPRNDDTPVQHSDKAKANAFLSWKPRPEVHVGIAAQRGYWDLAHSCFDSTKQFLRDLFTDA